MLTQNEAYDRFRKEHKNLVVKEMYELPPKYYLFMAIEKSLEEDVDDPFYAMDKNSGKVYSYSPLADLDNFDKARQGGNLLGG